MTIRRWALFLTLGALLALPAAAARASSGGAGYQLRHVDTVGFPTVRVVVRGTRTAAPPSVFENGVRVSLTNRQNLGQSKALVVAIDRSQSMRASGLEAAARAATELLDRKRPADEVSIVTFASRAQAQTTFSTATIDAETALRALSVSSTPGTALYDAVRLSARALASQPLPGRVLVLLTDGYDVGSRHSVAQAIRTARRAGVVVYTIGFGGHADTTTLRRLARDTAGAYYGSPTAASLKAIYRRIATELDRTWTMAYVTAARPGQRITVGVGATAAAAARAQQSVVIPGGGSVTATTWMPHFLLTAGGVAIVSLLVGLAVFLIVLRLQALPRAERMKRRVWEHTEERRRPRRAPLRRRMPTTQAVLSSLDTRLRNLPQWTRLSTLVERSGLPVPPSAVLVSAVALALLLAVLGAATGGGGFLVFLLIVIGLGAPLVVLRVIATRRLRAFDNQLPDLLASMASTLRAGHGLRTALQAVADEGTPPASVELRRVLSEARLGRPLDEALISMCERLGWDDLLYVATAVQVQSQVGGSLAGVFTTVAETVRQRQQHRRRIRALTASGRSTAIVLSVMPFVFAGLLALINPTYIMPFLRSHTGHILLIACVISIAIGASLLNRIVNVKA
ncbi:MAG TPA: VWA domain-containing protein [Gaiellaceae bacterium]|nr:VWA domain-containing protein [Gaiellaceae bacterium]